MKFAHRCHYEWQVIVGRSLESTMSRLQVEVTMSGTIMTGHRYEMVMSGKSRLGLYVASMLNEMCPLLLL